MRIITWPRLLLLAAALLLFALWPRPLLSHPEEVILLTADYRHEDLTGQLTPGDQQQICALLSQLSCTPGFVPFSFSDEEARIFLGVHTQDSYANIILGEKGYVRDGPDLGGICLGRRILDPGDAVRQIEAILAAYTESPTP